MAAGVSAPGTAVVNHTEPTLRTGYTQTTQCTPRPAFFPVVFQAFSAVRKGNCFYISDSVDLLRLVQETAILSPFHGGSYRWVPLYPNTVNSKLGFV